MAEKASAARKPRKKWTDQDTEELRELRARNWTDERIAKRLDAVRITILRRREAMGLGRCEHPKKRDRLGDRMIRLDYMRRAKPGRQQLSA